MGVNTPLIKMIAQLLADSGLLRLMSIERVMCRKVSVFMHRVHRIVVL